MAKNKPPSHLFANRFRLPVGSKFEATYHEDGFWRGTLTVPGMGVLGKKARNIHAMMTELGRIWKHLNDTGQKPRPISVDGTPEPV